MSFAVTELLGLFPATFGGMLMKSFVAAAALGVGLIVGTAGAAIAAPIVYDFSSVANVVNLGPSETYAAGSGTPTITAYSGFYSSNTVTRSGILVGNNRGADEKGLGACLGSTEFFGSCGPFGISSNPEIDASSKEVVQLDITTLLAAGYNSLMVNADSATGSPTELLLAYGSGSPTVLGTLLASISSASGNVSITQNGNYLNFTADLNRGGDVLLRSLTADKVATPEPASMAILGVGLLGLGLTRRLRSKA